MTKAKIALPVAIILAFAPGCGRSTPEGRSAQAAVTIAAAADLRFALDELTALFLKEHADIALTVSYGSSGIEYAQLVNRAPFDLFLSADVAFPRQLAERGLTLPGSEFTYAVGRIVLWAPASSPIDVAGLGMNALKEPTIAHVAIASPEHAPYGRAAEAAMRSAGVYDLVKSKLVFGENVSQALQFVQSGSADLGIVALSLALSPTVAGAGRFWEVPADAYPRIEQGGAILQWATNPDAARSFRSFMLSEQGRAVLKRYGFYLPGE